MDVFTLGIRRQRFFEFQLLNSRQFTVIKLKYKSHLILKKKHKVTLRQQLARNTPLIFSFPF